MKTALESIENEIELMKSFLYQIDRDIIHRRADLLDALTDQDPCSDEGAVKILREYEQTLADRDHFERDLKTLEEVHKKMTLYVITHKIQDRS